MRASGSGFMAVGLLLLACAAKAQLSYTTVALSGQPVVGLGPDVTYGAAFGDVFTTGNPIINNHGHVVFNIGLAGGDVIDDTQPRSNKHGLFLYAGGHSVLLVREGDAAPGAPQDITFRSFLHPVLNESGQTAFQALFRNDIGGATAPDNGLFVVTPDTMTPVAIAGMPAPTPSATATYFALGGPLMNDRGDLTFQATLTTASGSGRGIFYFDGGVVEPVAVGGTRAPGTEPDVRFQFFTPVVLNSSGEAVFSASLTGRQTPLSPEDRGLFSHRDGVTDLVLRSGFAAPVSGPIFARIFDAVVNAEGHKAFFAQLLGSTGPLSSGPYGVFVEDQGQVRTVVREGQFLPEVDPGARFFRSFNPLINDAGQVVVHATINGAGVDSTNDHVILLETDRERLLIAREGGTVPDGGPGVVFHSFSEDTVINAAGQVAFLANLAGDGVGFANSRGLYATDRDGLLTMVVRTGMPFNVDPSLNTLDLRTISRIDMVVGSGGGDGRGTSFNDAGRLAFRLGFTDGTSGVFIATIPEPAAALVLVGILTCRRVAPPTNRT